MTLGGIQQWFHGRIWGSNCWEVHNGDRYAAFDVEDILYNVGLINYKDNNEGIYKVIWPYAVFEEKLDKRTPRELKDILDA